VAERASHAQIDAAAAQLDDRGQFRGHDAHRIEDVREAAIGEIAGLGQGRDGDAAIMAFDRPAADLERLRRLEVRPQHDAGRAQAIAHALEVAIEDCPVENEGGRRQVVDCLAGHGAILACRSKTNASLCWTTTASSSRSLRKRPV
jgi:hypothetical protein